MEFPRHFTLEEATAALPQVERLLLRLRDLRDRSLQVELRQEVETEARAAQAVIEQLRAMGCILRDLDLGLVDFPAQAAGTEVFLCWRLGEDTIRYWHGTAEGYADRKPLTLLPRGTVH